MTYQRVRLPQTKPFAHLLEFAQGKKLSAAAMTFFCLSVAFSFAAAALLVTTFFQHSGSGGMAGKLARYVAGCAVV